MRALIVPQEFKGTLTAVEAAEAIAAGLRVVLPDWQTDLLPMADGGPGTTAALLAALGGEEHSLRVHDPLMRPVDATWGRLLSGVGVIECAAASGLLRLQPFERDPRRATSYGTGELVKAALDAGCNELIVGLGGSATNDGGAGLAQALGFRLLDAAGRDLPPGGAPLINLDHIDASGAHPGIASTRVTGATDVTNPLVGPQGASVVYGPQKGADTAAVRDLDLALAHYATIVKRDLGVEVHDLPGAGAAGGLGAGLIAFMVATLRSGAAVVGEAAGIEARTESADVVVTGEGRLDGQTAFGKATAYVAEIARRHAKPVVCIAGVLGPGHERVLPWFDAVEATSAVGDALPSPAEAALQLTGAAQRIAKAFANGRPASIRARRGDGAPGPS